MLVFVKKMLKHLKKSFCIFIATVLNGRVTDDETHQTYSVQITGKYLSHCHIRNHRIKLEDNDQQQGDIHF